MIGRRSTMLSAAFARDRSGTAAIEFALVVPGLLTLAIGCYEAANLMLADLKLEAAAETAADLVAQTRINTVLQNSDFTNISNAVTQVMSPFPTSSNQLKIAYASVTYKTGSPLINWHASPIALAPQTWATRRQDRQTVSSSPSSPTPTPRRSVTC
jgi:Flp pilus assembly protein TadG